MMRDKNVEPVGGHDTLPASRFGKYSFLVLVLFAALNATAAFLLPQDKFLRYQAPLDPESPTAPWIYERIHKDPRPIDIAFIGTSRTGLSVHTRRLEDRLAKHGIEAKAVNLYMVKSGINIQYVIAKELLSTRKVKLLVLEITEREERKPHEDFIYLADSVDILDAPLIINVNYLADLARLPGRQMDLFWQTESRRLGLAAPDAQVPAYPGPNLDHAAVIKTLDGVEHDRDLSHSLAEMEKMREEQLHKLTPPVLPHALNDIEFRLPRYYENKILDLAKAHGVAVIFLYTPLYGGPDVPAPYARYASRAGLMNPWPSLQNYRLWGDANHVNWEGAKLVTDYVGDILATQPELRKP